jgi:predicted nucleic acid-binding protein
MTESREFFRLYLDANVFIYAVEGDASLSDPLREFFGRLRQKKGIAVTSELTLAEVLPKARSIDRSSYFDLIVHGGIVDLVPVSRDVLLETAEYRRSAGMPKLPDAIHVVTALQAGCRRILSRDMRLKLPEGYAILPPDAATLSDLGRELS